jgi:hypothetical protein
MSRRVGVDPERRLIVGSLGERGATRFDHERLRSGDVRDRNVEVEQLRIVVVGPRRSAMVDRTLHRQAEPLPGDRDPVVG